MSVEQGRGRLLDLGLDTEVDGSGLLSNLEF